MPIPIEQMFLIRLDHIRLDHIRLDHIRLDHIRLDQFLSRNTESMESIGLKLVI